MCRKLWVGFILAVAFNASAETGVLNGTVSSQSGKAITGAIVQLTGLKLKDTTDLKGAYSISVPTAAVTPVPILPSTEKIAMNRGIISLCLTSAAPVTIELFDMQGTLLKRVVNNLTTAGDYQFNLMNHQIAATMMVIRVSIGRTVSSFRYLPLSNGMQTFSSSHVTPSTNVGLAKIKATVDTLNVTASGYIAKSTAISSFKGTVNITLDTSTLAKFSFFVTSLKALQEFSGSQNGFGGDFRFGKTGQGAGLLGADSICQCIAEKSMPGSKVKQWRAFLSVTKGPNGTQVNAIDRIGQGPWYDRLGRLLAPTLTDLKNTRPMNGDATIKNDLPNEDGVPNHRPDPTKAAVDNHHMLTGSGTDGKLYSATATCDDWTSTTYSSGVPRCGFAWPRSMGKTTMGGSSSSTSHWISGWNAGGCVAGMDLNESSMAGASGDKSVGKGGGYGGFYCFALNP
jgi:hypothetical protein